MYDPEYTRTFYNAFGEAEWLRLETTAFGHLQAIIHEDFIRRYLKPGDSVLDAGCGPGRFSIVAAKLGAKVTALDISDRQLELAKQKIAVAGQTPAIKRFVRGDICDLAMFPDNSFDLVICFGGALSYVCEKRHPAAGELTRMAKKGGVILVSVMSLAGAILGVTRRPDVPMLENQDRTDLPIPTLREVLETHDISGFPSRPAKMAHAAMHLFTAEELQALFRGCEILDTAGSAVMIREGAPAAEQITQNPAAWATLVELEKRFNHLPGLVDSGSHIILAMRK